MAEYSVLCTAKVNTSARTHIFRHAYTLARVFACIVCHFSLLTFHWRGEKRKVNCLPANYLWHANHLARLVRLFCFTSLCAVNENIMYCPWCSTHVQHWKLQLTVELGIQKCLWCLCRSFQKIVAFITRTPRCFGHWTHGLAIREVDRAGSAESPLHDLISLYRQHSAAEISQLILQKGVLS